MAGHSLLARNTVANLIGRVAAIVLALVVSTALFTFLGPTDYGIWSLLVAIAGYSMLFDFGISAAVERRVAIRNARGDRQGIGITLTSALTLLVSGLGVLQIAFVVWLLAAKSFEWPTAQFARGLLVLPVAWAMTTAGLIVGSGLSGLQQMGLLQRWRIAGLAFGSIAVLGLLAAGVRRMDALLVAYCSGGVVTALLQWLALRESTPALHFKFRWDTSEIGELMRFGGVLQIATTIPPVAEYALRLLIGARFGVEMAGIYDLAVRAAIVLRSLAGSLFTAMVPFGVHAMEEGGAARLEQLLRVTLRYTALFMVPATALVFWQADTIVGLWLGHGVAAQQVAQGVRILVVAHAIGALSGPITMVGRAAGRPIFEAAITAASWGTALVIGLFVSSWPVMFGLGWGIAAIGGLVLWALLTRAHGLFVT